MPTNAPPNSVADRFLASVGALPVLAPGTSLGIAVSGGPDSLALAHMTCSLLPHVQVRLVVVDHGLRDESAAEASLVRERLLAFCEDVTILTWRTPSKVTSRKLEQARNARYALLNQWAAERGVLRLWLGHHADDQAETITMRQQQGSGATGLRGMSARRVMAQTVYERPLLGWSKSHLVAYCEAQGLQYVTDPTNADRATARGALRTTSDHSEPSYPVSDPRRTDTKAVVTHPLGHAWVRTDSLEPSALQAVVGWVRGSYYAPSWREVEAAVEHLRSSARISVFGCVVEPRQDGWTLVAREARQLRLSSPKQDELGIWRLDDRWQVDDPSGDWGLLGPNAAEYLSDLPIRTLASLPTWNGLAPVLENSSLKWPGNCARFSPRRPVFDLQETQ